MARKGIPTPKVSWPDLRTPPDSWSLAEVTGVAINPLVTGIGTHPRSVSDEDWVASCEAVIRNHKTITKQVTTHSPKSGFMAKLL